MVPVLSYGRTPVRRVGGESVRAVRHAGGVRVAVFPPGPWRGDFVSMLMSALLVAGVAAGATVWFSYHPAPLARYAATVWPLAVLLLFFLAVLSVAYDEAYRQVEFEVDADDLVRLSFGPFGVRRRHWSTESIVAVRVARHVSGSHPRVVLLTNDGRGHDLFVPGASSALSPRAEQVAAQLRQALRLPPVRNSAPHVRRALRPRLVRRHPFPSGEAVRRASYGPVNCSNCSCPRPTGVRRGCGGCG